MATEALVRGTPATTTIDRGMLPTTEVVSRVARIQEVMRAVMKEGTHYGTIPGTNKPTLYKPGAELLLMTFRIAAMPALTEDLSTDDEVRYRVTARAVSQVTGETLGEASGECSSSETKYRWVKPVCDEEWDETDPAMRREKWMKGNDGPYKVKQIRSSPADVANTILKMAYKRALIALALQVLAASDIFAQDLEDLDAQLRESLGDDAPQGKKPTMTPPAKKSAAPKANVVTGKVQAVDEKSGTKNGKKWTKFSVKVDDKWHGTFDPAHRDVAVDARAAGLPVTIEFKATDFGRDIVRIKVAEPESEPAPAAAAAPAPAAESSPNGQLPIEREPGEEG